MNVTACLAMVALLLTNAAAQSSAPKAGSAKPPLPKPGKSAVVNPGASKFKAIWEPVPFNKDLHLNAISCPGPETCFVVGNKSTILATTDGGTTWQVQLGGDPESIDRDLKKVFFLDAKHGWAMTDGGKILGTRDGGTWEELSTVSGTARAMWFLSPQSGYEIENADSTSESTLRRTDDGGKTWKPVSRCSVNTTIDGLPRKLGCVMSAMQFLSPSVGFTGGAAGVSMGKSVAAFGKTSDGGLTWTTSVLPETKWGITHLNFWTEKDGIAILAGGEAVYWTADAGETWTRSVKERQWPSSYGVGEGKIIVGITEAGGIGYSFNGGRTFTSRPFQLPAWVLAVTFPDAQHGYLVGRHAMAYRYRIVPAGYTSPGMIAAAAP